MLNERHAWGAGLVSFFALFLAACGGGDEPRGADAPLCSPRSVQRPCADARVEVDYRIRIWTHCGVSAVYLNGRWWRIDPPQPEENNWIGGTARLLNFNEMAFQADDGRRYAFAQAPPAWMPPPCI